MGVPTMKKFLVGCALSALAASSAYAQSTGSQQFDNQEIVITGTTTSKGVDGVIAPDTSKTRQVLTSQIIQHQTPGQTIDEIINLVPGVSFQNNDGYGSAGGTLFIRGFDASRISQTFDGIPLNDTGNYALYSNQQIDPELIDQVNVSLGSTDIDSPTASATGSTVNYITRTPSDDFHLRIQGSMGDYHMSRFFGVVDTGDLTSIGTRAWFSASKQGYNVPFNNFGKIDKTQYNAKIYQPIGSNGDFISIAGHYNRNRNNFFGSVPLRTDLTQSPINSAPRLEGSTSGNRFPLTKDERYYFIPPCIRALPGAGTAQVETSSVSSLTQTAANCGALFDYRYNPSNTGNIRVNSRFTLAPGVVLTVDPSFQYTNANGGGTIAAKEGTFSNSAHTVSGLTGYYGGSLYVGHDLNGDGDALDTINLLTPSNTVTHRYGVIANLIWQITPSQTFRVNYTLDYGHHRQTGEAGYLNISGYAQEVFPIHNPILDANGRALEKRDRLSLAILNQLSAQYRGKFVDDKLTVDVGLRAPFFQRKLHNFCFTTAANGNVDCTDENDTATAAYAAANPGYAPPQRVNRKFHKLLPAAGVTYEITPLVSAYGSYSRGLQVPGTDDLYNAFYPGSPQPKAETSDNFDGGLRMRSGKIQAQIAAWYTIFENRIESSFDPVTQLSTFQNLGTVHKYGLDGSVSYKVAKPLTVYAFGSILHSKILKNVQLGVCPAASATSQLTTTPPPAGVPCSAATAGQPIYALTAGKFESAASKYEFGGRIEGNFGPIEIGGQVKRTGPRFINDQNTPVYQSYVTGTGASAKTVYYQVYGAKTPAYTIVDLDARISLEPLVHNDRTYFQFNVTNLFDKLYVGGFGSSSSTVSNTSVTNVQIGAPRTVSGTLVVAF